MNRSLFVTDLDGTLFNDDRAISERDLDTLARLRSKGVVVAVATGRSIYSFHKALAHMDLEKERLPVDYLLFSTGAGILDLKQDRIVRHLAILRPDVEKICTCFGEAGCDYMVHKAIPETHFFLYRSHGHENPDFHKRIGLYQSFATPLQADTLLYASATQVLAIVPHGLSPDQVTEWKSVLAGYSVIHATSPLDHRSAWIEVFHPKASKSQAAAWLAARFQIPRTRVVAVGNDFNDQDLLEWAGQSFCVANTVPGMNTGFLLPVSNNADGVTQAAAMSGLLD
ncbi:MAG: HAD family hydrolase [Desulfotignum sp.]|jgi:Cof subfamily protein (haloacid dehalogenase superfamily)|nr:HAD family hydrolase [Desulfotignum sp.]